MNINMLGEKSGDYQRVVEILARRDFCNLAALMGLEISHHGGTT